MEHLREDALATARRLFDTGWRFYGLDRLHGPGTFCSRLKPEYQTACYAVSRQFDDPMYLWVAFMAVILLLLFNMGRRDTKNKPFMFAASLWHKIVFFWLSHADLRGVPDAPTVTELDHLDGEFSSKILYDRFQEHWYNRTFIHLFYRAPSRWPGCGCSVAAVSGSVCPEACLCVRQANSW